MAKPSLFKIAVCVILCHLALSPFREQSSYLKLYYYDKTSGDEGSVSSSSSYNVTQNRYMIGTWENDTWIAPLGWKTFSKKELLQVYKSKSMLWYGDSLARRASMTMYAKMNSIHEDPPPAEINSIYKIDLGKHNKGWNESCPLPCGPKLTVKLCRPMPPYNKTAATATPPNRDHVFSFASHTFLSDLWQTALDEIHQPHNTSFLRMHTDVMVVSLGMWDYAKPGQCPERRKKGRSVIAILQDAVTAVDIMARETNTLVVWRTVVPKDEVASAPFFNTLNNNTMNMIDTLHENGRKSNVIYVNWAGAMEPRTFGDQRFHGDLKTHLGLIPRVVLIDMVTNAIQDFWRARPYPAIIRQ